MRLRDWWLRHWWRPPPPLPVRPPSAVPFAPDSRPPWIMSAAASLRDELAPREEAQVLTLTVKDRHGAYAEISIAPGELWPRRHLLAEDGSGALWPVEVPRDVSELED